MRKVYPLVELVQPPDRIRNAVCLAELSTTSDHASEARFEADDMPTLDRPSALHGDSPIFVGVKSAQRLRGKPKVNAGQPLTRPVLAGSAAEK